MTESPGSRLCLLVEDQPRSRDWLLGILTAAFPGIGVVALTRRSEALSWLSERRAAGGAPGFDLAIIDLGLPDGSGVDIVRSLVESWPSVTPVIATIYDDDAHLFAALAAGASGYILRMRSLTCWSRSYAAWTEESLRCRPPLLTVSWHIFVTRSQPRLQTKPD